MFAGAGIALFLFTPRIHAAVTKRRYSQAFDDPANRAKYGERKVTITQEGIEDSSEIAESSLKWSGIVKVDQTPTHGFLFVTSTNAYVIPREAIGDEQFELFMETVTDLWETAAAQQYT